MPERRAIYGVRSVRTNYVYHHKNKIYSTNHVVPSSVVFSFLKIIFTCYFGFTFGFSPLGRTAVGLGRISSRQAAGLRNRDERRAADSRPCRRRRRQV